MLQYGIINDAPPLIRISEFVAAIATGSRAAALTCHRFQISLHNQYTSEWLLCMKYGKDDDLTKK